MESATRANQSEGAGEARPKEGGDARSPRRVLAASAIAAGAGAAVVVGRKVLSSKHGSQDARPERSRSVGSGGSDAGEQGPRAASKAKQAAGKTLKRAEGAAPTIKTAGRELSKKNLIPLAESLAASAGKYAATNGPELLRERILPRFVRAFDEARGDATQAET